MCSFYAVCMFTVSARHDVMPKHHVITWFLFWTSALFKICTIALNVVGIN